MKTSSYRKVLSRCRDYASDFSPQAFLYNVSMARTISSVVNIAESKKMAPETLASEMAAFEMYWHRVGQKLEDICRQMNGRLPELFFTLAPAEWGLVTLRSLSWPGYIAFHVASPGCEVEVARIAIDIREPFLGIGDLIEIEDFFGGLIWFTLQ